MNILLKSRYFVCQLHLYKLSEHSEVNYACRCKLAAIFSKTLFMIDVCLNLMSWSEYIFCILLTRNSIFSLNILIFNNKCISVVCDFNWFNTSSYFFLLHTSLNRMTLTKCLLNFVHTFKNVLYLSKLTL